MARLRLRNPAAIVVGLTTVVVTLVGVGVQVTRGAIAEKLSKGFVALSRSKDYDVSKFDADLLSDVNTGGGLPLTLNPDASQIARGRRVLVVLAQTKSDGTVDKSTAFVARYVVTRVCGTEVDALLESERVGAATSQIAPIGGFRALSIDQVAALVATKAKGVAA